MLATAITTMVALAFVVPLGLLVRQLAEDRAMSEARQLAQLFAPSIATGDRAGITLALQTAAATSDEEVTVYPSDGESRGAPAPKDANVERAAAGEAFTVASEDGVALYTPLLEAGDGTAVVRVFVPREVLTAGVIESWAVLAGLGTVLVLVALMVSDRLARAVVAPTRDAAAAARALAEGDRTARAPVDGPPEIADVATALNTLADRIDALLLAEREAAADLSHRLRTPMTALRLDAEAVADPDARQRLTAGLDDLEREVDRVIRDARRPGAQLGAVTDVGAVVRRRVEFWSALADEEGRPWSLDVPDLPVLIGTDEDEFSAALDALLGNVLAHTPAGGGFRVELTVNDRTAVCTVEDEGPGWPPGDLTERGTSGGGSTGLGLDIVRRTAERTGGELRLVPSPSGGARAELVLPLAP